MRTPGHARIEGNGPFIYYMAPDMAWRVNLRDRRIYVAHKGRPSWNRSEFRNEADLIERGRGIGASPAEVEALIAKWAAEIQPVVKYRTAEERLADIEAWEKSDVGRAWLAREEQKRAARVSRDGRRRHMCRV